MKTTKRAQPSKPGPRSQQRVVRAITDNFNGNNKHLKACILALIELSDEGSLVPHGIGGHARALLAACYHRLP